MAEQLSPSQRGKIRTLSQGRELAPDEEGDEPNVVPFRDTIVNILLLVLAALADTSAAPVETTPPAAQGSGVRADIPRDALNLPVYVINDGCAIKGSGG